MLSVGKTKTILVLVMVLLDLLNDSFRFLSMSFDRFVRTVDNDDFIFLKTDFSNEWEYLNKKIVFPYEY